MPLDDTNVAKAFKNQPEKPRPAEITLADFSHLALDVCRGKRLEEVVIEDKHFFQDGATLALVGASRGYLSDGMITALEGIVATRKKQRANVPQFIFPVPRHEKSSATMRANLSLNEIRTIPSVIAVKADPHKPAPIKDFVPLRMPGLSTRPRRKSDDPNHRKDL